MTDFDSATKAGRPSSIAAPIASVPGKGTRTELDDGAPPAVAPVQAMNLAAIGPSRDMVTRSSRAIAQQLGSPRTPGVAVLEQQIAASSHPDVIAARAAGGVAALAKATEGRAMEIGGWLVGEAELTGFRYGVKHYMTRVDSGLFRGSRFEQAQDVEVAVAAGVRSTVNLCLEDTNGDAGNHYGIDVRKFGLATHHVPILDNTPPTIAQMDEFVTFASANQPCYVHCEAGKGRTGVAVSCWRIAVDHVTADQAIAEAVTFGMSLKNQQDFVRAYASHIEAQRGPAR